MTDKLVRKTSPWGPFGNFLHSFDEFQRDLERVFHSVGVPTVRGMDMPNLIPPVELVEKEKSYELAIEIPGVNQTEVSVSVENDVLIISGEKKQEEVTDKDDIYMSERFYGAFRREIRIPENIIKEKIDAVYVNGVLKVTIPKSEQTKPTTQKIEVRTS